MKLCIVYGTRPEAIKVAPVIQAARKVGLSCTILSTGQHREMLRSIIDFFQIVADVDLDLMRPGQTPSGLLSRALAALDPALEHIAPDLVLVQGDTTTALAAALAAFHHRIPVGHIEAGLRTDRRDAPFPEEVNRRLIGQLAQHHFAPTETAANLLRRDGIEHFAGAIHVVGNTVIDALMEAVERVRKNPPDSPLLRRMQAHSAAGKPVVLITGHRRENFGEPFREFCFGLADIADARPDALLVYPVHLNPNVQAPVRELLGNRRSILLTEPADYPLFVAMMDTATLLITDSGGIQEEAPALGKPVLVTRDVTERPEAVEAGGVLLVGPHRESLRREALRLLENDTAYAAMAIPRFPYGDGKAASRIIDLIRRLPS